MEKGLGVLLEKVSILDRVDKALQRMEGSELPSPDQGKKVQHDQTQPPTMDSSGVFCVGSGSEAILSPKNSPKS